MTDDGAPDGWKRIDGRVQSAWLSPEGRIVLLGSPPNEEDRPEGNRHNCDAMGCGQDHVIFRGRLIPGGIDAARVMVGGSVEFWTDVADEKRRDFDR